MDKHENRRFQNPPANNRKKTAKTRPLNKWKRKRVRLTGTWSKNEAIKLIRTIERHEGLWNPECVEYRNNYRRNSTWHNVAETMGRCDDACSAKWNSLRSNYRATITKMNLTPDGQEALQNNQLPEPYCYMRFLHSLKSVQSRFQLNNTMTAPSPAPSSTNTDYNDDDDEDDTSMLSNGDDDDIDPGNSGAMYETDGLANMLSERRTLLSPPNLGTSFIAHPKGVHQLPEADSPIISSAIVKKMNEAIGSMRHPMHHQSMHQNAWSAFGAHICETGRSMERTTPMLARQMRLEMQKTILKFETMALEQDNGVFIKHEEDFDC